MNYLPTVITFRQIYQRIGELINENRYLNERELEEYSHVDPDENSVIDFYDVRFSYKLGDTAFLNGKPYIISALSDSGIMAYPEDSPLFVEKFPRPLFDEMLNVSAADNKHLIVRGTITYDIYQLGDTDDAHKMMFRSLENIHNQGLTINHADYEKVYSGEMKRGETLEDIYETFNVHHPEDFTGHSLSTSDSATVLVFQKSKAFLNKKPSRNPKLRRSLKCLPKMLLRLFLPLPGFRQRNPQLKPKMKPKSKTSSSPIMK